MTAHGPALPVLLVLLLLQVDGGINAETAAVAVEAGANVLVAGSAIFCTPDPQQAMQDIRHAAAAISN
jgi:ribulose-phosphate 3-epimerase